MLMEFYEACISGEITREQCKPRRDASTMYSKIGVMEKILDLRNSKCYKIGEKDLVTRDNDFEMATGNSTGVIGYDSRIKKKGTNQVDRTKAPVPTTLLNSAITNYCSDPQKIMFILQKTDADDTYNKLFLRNKDRSVSNRKRGLHRCVEIIDFIVMINLYLFGEIILN